MAYYQAIGQFLDWCQRAGLRNLEDIEPIHVAAYIEQHPGSAGTIKQHMAAIRMMFSWPSEKGILAINPAREVKTPKFSRTKGKTPAFSIEEVQKVLASIDASHVIGHRVGTRTAAKRWLPTAGYGPYGANQAGEWRLVTLASYDAILAPVTESLNRTLGILFATLVGAVGLGLWLARRLADPILKITESAKTIAAGRFDAPPGGHHAR